ncbi:hypothetical protein WMF38_52075 [Sorangium sp. So ce118]
MTQAPDWTRTATSYSLSPSAWSRSASASGSPAEASTLGPPGKGGISWDDQGKMISGEDGVAVETRRLAESLEWSSPAPAQRPAARLPAKTV